MIRYRALFPLLAVALLGSSLLVAAVNAAAVAPGCTPTQPTYVGGTIRGYPDNRYVNTHIGVQLVNTAGRTISPTGTVLSGGYSWIEKLNSGLPPTGDLTGSDRWGACVASAASQVFVEAYPKRPSPDPMVTDFTRYGDTAYYYGRLTVGGRNLFGLRLPTIFQQGGNTGGVQGYIWHAGKAVPSSAISKVRAFTQQPGPVCGVEGLAASAAALGSATGPDRTYYRTDYLSAGQCSAPWQLYSLQVTCHAVCGAVDRTVAVLVRVVRGRWPRVDIQF